MAGSYLRGVLQTDSRSMAKFTYWAPVPCESEWASRSLTELVACLIHRYRQPTQRRIETITSTLARVLPSTPQRREAYDRLAIVFTSLCEAIETHAWLVDHVLGPALAKMEHDPASTSPSDREDLRQTIVYGEDERTCLRRESVALGYAVLDIAGAPVPVNEAVLAVELDMLVLLVNEQLDLEDRCLWPRALDLTHWEM
jgi:hypothetical protein